MNAHRVVGGSFVSMRVALSAAEVMCFGFAKQLGNDIRI